MGYALVWCQCDGNTTRSGALRKPNTDVVFRAQAVLRCDYGLAESDRNDEMKRYSQESFWQSAYNFIKQWHVAQRRIKSKRWMRDRGADGTIVFMVS